MASRLFKYLTLIKELPRKVEDFSQEIASLQDNVRSLKSSLAENTLARYSPSGKIKCLFLIHNSSVWESLAPLYFRMQQDSRFEPIVASIDNGNLNHHLDGERDIHSFLLRTDIEHIRLGQNNLEQALDILRAIAPDIIFRQSHWEGDVAPCFSGKTLNFAKLVYISYEMAMLIRNEHMNDGINPVMVGDFHDNVWKIFCANDLEKNLYKEASVRGDDHVIATGHPKMALFRDAKRNRHCENQRRKIICSSHHSIDTAWSNFGTFQSSYAQMLTMVRDNPEIDFVFSPHPSLRRSTLEPLGSAFFDDYLNEWNSLPNGSLHLGGNYSELFDTSDALMTDGVSWLLEYQIFDKPLAFIERPDHIPFNPLGEKASEGFYCVGSHVQALQYIKDCWANGADPMSEARHRIAADLFPQGDIISDILNHIADDFIADLIQA